MKPRSIAAFVVLLAGCAGMPTVGTYDHEHWCLNQRAIGQANPDPSCDTVFEAVAKRKKAKRESALQKQAELAKARARWEEYARQNPKQACLILAQRQYKRCVASVKDEADFAAEQARIAQRHRDAAALLAAQPKRRYSTPAGAALGGLANALRQAEISSHARQSSAAPYDAALGLAVCRETFSVEMAACEVMSMSYQESPTQKPPAGGGKISGNDK